MNRTEAAMLLTVAASFDRRTFGEEDATAWAVVLQYTDFADARDAVVQHYANERTWVMPADVLRLVRRARLEATRALPMPNPPAALADDPAAEQAWLRAYRGRINAGDEPQAAYATACAYLNVQPDPPAVEAAPGRLRAVLAAATPRTVPRG